MLPPEIIEKVLEQARTAAKHSWEYGTIFEALLDYHNTSFSIFNDPFPDGKTPVLDESQVHALAYVAPFILTDGDQLCDGSGSTSDPTSLLISSLLLSAHNSSYLPAIHRQLHTLLHLTPRFPNTAISHRSAYPSLWADFIYMVPPALAYYGVYSNDLQYVRLGVRQCELYEEVLVTEGGCWRHIKNLEEGEGRKRDDNYWSTSNGWAAMGMARVLGTLVKSRFCDQTAQEQKSLIRMVKRIIDGVISLDTHHSGLLRNRLDDETWFGECAGTALLAATVFRMAVLSPDVFRGRYTEWAVSKMSVVEMCVNEEGVVAPVVNPTIDEQRWPLEGVSPEAQAFVVLLWAARRELTGGKDTG